MKKFILENIRVMTIAAAILLLSAGVLFTTVSFAQGAEAGKTVIEESTYAETISTQNPQVLSKTEILPSSSAPLASEEPVLKAGEPSPLQSQYFEYAEPSSSRSEAASSAAPSLPPNNAVYLKPSQGAEYISENDAKNIFIKTASDLFGITIDKSALNIEFHNDSHAIWVVTADNCNCTLDAISGAVVYFSMYGEYTGKKITYDNFISGNYESMYSQTNPVDMNNSPDNIYIKAALQIVNAKLAGGRAIDNIEIFGVQFGEGSNSGDPKTDALTIQVNCHVYMHTGYSYTLSFWGTENPELRLFCSHPTQDACRWGYFYEEDASNYPPEPSGGWNTAPGIITGQNASVTPQPSVTP